MNLTGLTKQKLIEYIEGMEETRFDNFKLQLGLPYDDEEAWIGYIKKLQELNAERLKDCEELTQLLKVQRQQLQVFVESCSR